MKINFSIIFNLIIFLLLFITFFTSYEYLFITRVILLIFTITSLIIELKKDYFIKNKNIFFIFNTVIMICLIISIFIDDSSNNKIFLIPVFMFILISIMYKEIYSKNI